MVPIDPDRLSLPDSQRWNGKLPILERPPRHQRGEEFLKGPIPMNWLAKAAALPGRSPLAVALALWFEAGRKKRRRVVLTQKVLDRLSVSRKSGYRGLAHLEGAQLVQVERRTGRSPKVTALDVSDPMKC